jgi:hypothetical protein
MNCFKAWDNMTTPCSAQHHHITPGSYYQQNAQRTSLLGRPLGRMPLGIEKIDL